MTAFWHILVRCRTLDSVTTASVIVEGDTVDDALAALSVVAARRPRVIAVIAARYDRHVVPSSP
jgi:hypothetical protein